MTYAIVEIAGKQYKVSPGDKITVDRLSGQAGDTIKLDRVLLSVDQDQILLGRPYLKNSTLTATIDSHSRGSKVRVAKFKAKSRYRRIQGHRQNHTTLIISSSKASPTPQASTHN